MTTQAPQATGPQRLDPRLYRRTRVTAAGAGGPDPGLEDLRVNRQSGSAPAVVALESADVAVLALFAEGLSPSGIGRRLGVNERTIRRRLNRLCERLGVATPMQAVVWSVRRGVI